MTLAAYMVNAPYKMDVAGLEQKAQMARQREFDLAKAPAEVDLANAKNVNDTNKEFDLGDYRARALGGDPNAIESLKGQPETFQKMTEAYDGMSPDEFLEAERHATAFGKAARRIQSFRPGSREQRQAWDDELGKLYSEGLIGKEDHDRWVAQGPNDDLIAEAMTIDQFTQTYVTKNPKLNAAKIGEIDNRNQNRNAVTDARVGDIGTDNERADRKVDASIDQGNRKTDATIEQGDRKTAAVEKNASTLETYRTRKTENDAADDTADNARGDKDTESKIVERKRTNDIRASKNTTVIPKQGEPATGEGGTNLKPNEYGKRIASIQRLIEQRRKEENLTDEELRPYERELRKKFNIPVDEPSVLDGGDGDKADAYTDPNAKPPPMKDRVIGKVYPSPNGPMEWTKNGWRTSPNG